MWDEYYRELPALEARAEQRFKLYDTVEGRLEGDGDHATAEVEHQFPVRFWRKRSRPLLGNR